MQLNTIPSENLTCGEVTGRTLYYGRDVDLGKLRHLYHFESRLFHNSGPLCSRAPLLLLSALILNRSGSDIISLFKHYGIVPSDDILSPIAISSNGLIAPDDWPFDPFRSHLTVVESINLGMKHSGISIVGEDYPGIYVGGTFKGRSFQLLRVLNTYQVNKNGVDPYFVEPLMFQEVGYNQGLRDALLSVVKDNMEQGAWIHTLIFNELSNIGHPVDKRLVTYTRSN